MLNLGFQIGQSHWFIWGWLNKEYPGYIMCIINYVFLIFFKKIGRINESTKHGIFHANWLCKTAYDIIGHNFGCGQNRCFYLTGKIRKVSLSSVSRKNISLLLSMPKNYPAMDPIATCNFSDFNFQVENSFYPDPKKNGTTLIPM